MSCPCGNYELSVPVKSRIKTQTEGNGYFIGGYCNEAARLQRDAPRVGLPVLKNFVAPLYKELNIARETRRAVNHDKLTEFEVTKCTGHES